jgi:hypothetical protein
MSTSKSSSFSTLVSLFIYTLVLSLTPSNSLAAREDSKTGQKIGEAGSPSKGEDSSDTKYDGGDPCAMANKHSNDSDKAVYNRHAKLCAEATAKKELSTLAQTCNSSADKYREKMSKFKGLCMSMNIGSDITKCKEQVKACGNAFDAEDHDTLEDLATSLGVPDGSDLAEGINKKCPKEFDTDHAKNVRDIQKDLSDEQKQLAKAKREVTTVKKASKAELIGIQQKIADLDSKVKDSRIKLDAQQRERLNQFNAQLSSATEQQAKLEAEVSDLIAEKSNILHQKSAEMADKLDDLLETTCTMQAKGKVDDLTKGTKSSSGSMSSQTKKNADRRNMYTMIKDACLAKMLAERKAVVEKFNRLIESTDRKRDTKTIELDNLRAQISQLRIDNSKERANAQTEKTNLEQDYANNARLLQAELMSAQQSFAEEQQEINNALMQSQMDINRKSNEMLMVNMNKPKPKLANEFKQMTEADSDREDISRRLRNTCCFSGEANEIENTKQTRTSILKLVGFSGDGICETLGDQKSQTPAVTPATRSNGVD